MIKLMNIMTLFYTWDFYVNFTIYFFQFYAPLNCALNTIGL